MIFSRVIHNIAGVGTSFFYIAGQYSIIYHVLLIHSSGDGHLGYVYLLVIVNNADDSGIKISAPVSVFGSFW
jgi:hypothetical protein